MLLMYMKLRDWDDDEGESRMCSGRYSFGIGRIRKVQVAAKDGDMSEVCARALESISDALVMSHPELVELVVECEKERVTGGEWPTAHFTPSCSTHQIHGVSITVFSY